MADFIIMAVIAIMILVGVHFTIKHFKGQGDCCGGVSYRPKKKRLRNIVEKKIFIVEGMHCDNCKKRVEEAVNDIIGAAGKVNLKSGELTVSYEKIINDELIVGRIEKAGYKVKRLNK